jgi:hypothetical protein
MEKGPIYASPYVSLNQVERGQIRVSERAEFKIVRQEKSERGRAKPIFA